MTAPCRAPPARGTGRLRQRSYETKEGEKRTVYEVEADEVGVSLRSATAKVTRAGRASAGGAARYGSPQARSPPRVSQTHGRPGPSRADSA